MTIRYATALDLDAINAIYNHYVLNTAITFDYDPWSIQRRQAWFEKLLNSDGYYHVLVKEDAQGMIVGFAYNGEFREKLAYKISSEITIYLHHERQAKGMGSELMTALLEKMNRSPIRRAYSVITLPNPASLRLHEKFGFKQVGYLTDVGYKFEQYYSVAILEKTTLDH
ncbi:N-acetyltransferase family protein [Enterovibrio sp. ZSDZ42]|uniref:N-acetyltransferase family protein n=1 Tax=Enterovibrio gelatinilyticus TaxID=2899819 RepID=A0ABT5R3C7_9GAMM|nr:GNAT family N-acetyltransferase [Enterovibrio sp. ZSDZ42]MDD1794754.1 N-acetyltransferase family protein [Enterovibrio sp. ZSDZ42]